MSNRKDGTDFEKELCKKLSNFGFWVHNFAQNRDGQPADIIAARDGKTYLIDAKVCKNDTFPLSRIEENQRLAMTYFRDCGNPGGWFALKTSQDIFMIPLSILIELLRRGEKMISGDNFEFFGRRLDSWANHIA